MSLKNNVLAIIIVLSGFYAQSQEDKKPLLVEKLLEMKSTNYNSLELIFFEFGAVDISSMVGFGARVELVDIVDKLSFHADFHKMYPVSFEDGFGDFKPSLFNFQMSYPLTRTDQQEEHMLTLKTAGNTIL